MAKKHRIAPKTNGKSPKAWWLAGVFGVLLALVATGAALLLMAWVIKTFSVGEELFNVINMVIKLLGVLVAVLFVTKRVGQKGFLVGAVMGPAYILTAFLLFIVLGGRFISLRTLLLDLLTGVAGGVLFGAFTMGVKKS